MGVRNIVAHIGQQDLEQPVAERSLDTMALLCKEIDSEGAEEIREIYRDVRARAAGVPSTAGYVGLSQISIDRGDLTDDEAEYLQKEVKRRIEKCFEPQPYVRTMTECLKYKTGSKGKDKDYITREGVFRYMWMNTELSDNHKEYIYEKYPNIWELQCCIREFRNIFKNHNVPMLYLFVEKYSKNLLKPLRSFAEGLKRDIDAVENAVAYDYSNGFVEGTNSRLKMIKRTMYGRCGRQLLEAKLRYMGYNNNNG